MKVAALVEHCFEALFDQHNRVLLYRTEYSGPRGKPSPNTYSHDPT